MIAKFRHGSAEYAERALRESADSVEKRLAAEGDQEKRGREHTAAAITYSYLAVVAEECNWAEKIKLYFSRAETHSEAQGRRMPRAFFRHVVETMESDTDRFLGVDPDGPNGYRARRRCRPTEP